jgi:hypothetical protein
MIGSLIRRVTEDFVYDSQTSIDHVAGAVAGPSKYASSMLIGFFMAITAVFIKSLSVPLLRD